MLDWTKIDNDKTFQRLVNHLFALECNSPGFIPSSPYIGADGGWDGAFEGSYEGLEGVFSIQAKWTTKDFKKAATWLKGEVRKEIKKALKNKVDHLRIATNAQLGKDHVSALQNLRPQKLRTLYVWHRENFEVRIERQPFVTHYFFGNPQFPTFIPSNIYMAHMESKLLSSPMVGRMGDLAYIENALGNDRLKVILLHAPGGHGKSHFLQALSEKLNESFKSKQVWFIRPGVRRIEDAIQDELIRGREYLLFLDDADRFLEDVKALLSIVRFEKNIQVILSSRTAGMSLVKDQLVSRRIQDCLVFELSALPEEDLEKILFAAAGKSDLKKSSQIIRHLNNNPYLIAQYGKRVKGDLTPGDLQKVFEKLTDDSWFEINRILGKDLKANQQVSLLVHLATLVPFQMNEFFCGELGKLTAIDPGKVKGAIERLTAARLLRTTGGTVRFDPDMVGDLVLSVEIGKRHSLGDALLEACLQLSPSRCLANIAAAFPYERPKSIPEAIERLIAKWIKTSAEHGEFEKSRNLENIRAAAMLVPGKVIELIYSYLSPGVTGDGSSSALNLDDVRPLVQSIGILPNYQIEIADLIKELVKREIKSRIGNDRAESLIDILVCPLNKSLALVGEVLNRCLDWCKSAELNENEADLAARAASEVLAGSHEYHEFDENKVTFGHKALRCTPEVERMRDQGLAILKALIERYDSPTFGLCGLEIAEKIGEIRLGGLQETELPLGARIARERAECLEMLDELRLHCTDLRVLAKLEDLLFKWWAKGKPGTEKALEMLKRIPRTPEYRFFKRFTDPEFLIDDMEELLNEVPEDGIWNWWWDNKQASSWNQDTDTLRRLALDLNKKYQKANDISEFLKQMDILIAPYARSPAPPVVRYWAEMDREPFIELSGDDRWQNLPMRFKGQVSLGIAKHQPEHIYEVEKEVVSALPDAGAERVHDFITLVVENSIPFEKIKPSLMEIAERGNVEVRSILISEISFLLRESKGRGSLFEIMERVTAHPMSPPVDRRLIDNLAYSLYASRDWPSSNSELENKVKSNLEAVIIASGKLDYHEIEIASFCFGDEIGSWLHFLGKRIDLADKLRTEADERIQFDSIPYDGVAPVKGAIKSYDDFSLLLAKVEEWDRRETEGLMAEYLLHPIKQLDFKNGREYFTTWVRERLAKKRVDDFETLLKYASFFKKWALDEELCCAILETGLELDLFPQAKSTIENQLGLSVFYGWENENTPSLAQSIEMCKKLISRCRSGQVGLFLRESLRSLEKMAKKTH
jgi:hypothetical protein